MNYFKQTPSWHSILLYHHSHPRDNVTAPHGRPNLRSRLHCCHAQEGGPRSLQGHVVAMGKKKKKREEEEKKQTKRHLKYMRNEAGYSGAML